MPDLQTALISACEKNINRYCRLLATPLTDLERDYIHRQIAKARLELEQLQQNHADKSEEQADVRTVIAARNLRSVDMAQ